jgi:hypothetical protein
METAVTTRGGIMGRFVSLMLLIACAGAEEGDACALADVDGDCPACSDGPVTCTFGDVSATENSCGDCQASQALFDALCAAGESATEAEIEAGMDCVVVTASEN